VRFSNGKLTMSRKRWEIRRRLLSTCTNRKRHIGFQMSKIIDLGWPWRSLTTNTVDYPSDSLASCSTCDAAGIVSGPSR